MLHEQECTGRVAKSSIILSFSLVRRIVLAGGLAAGAGATFAGEAGPLHLLPFVIDGDGVRTRLIVTNIAASSSRCSIELSGPDLDAERFREHFLVTAEDAEASFELEGDGGNLVWASKGERPLTFGYARLECGEPVTVQALITVNDSDRPVSMTNLPGARKGIEFRFSLIPELGSLALVFANDADAEVSCDVVLHTPYGSGLDTVSVSVPAMTSAYRMAGELFRIPGDYTAGTVLVSCDRELAAAGFLLNGGKFSALAPVVQLAPEIGISGGPAVSEGGILTFTITASHPSARDLTILLAVSGGEGYLDTADVGEKQVILGAGQTSVNYAIDTVDDADAGDGGVAVVKVNAADGYRVSETENLARLAVSDNDEPPPANEPPSTQPPPANEPPVTQPPPANEPPVTAPDPVPVPDPGPDSSTQVSMSLDARPESGRRFFFWIDTDPRDALLGSMTAYVDPFEAGQFYGGSLSVKYIFFRCASGFSGPATVSIESSINGQTVWASSRVTC